MHKIKVICRDERPCCPREIETVTLWVLLAFWFLLPEIGSHEGFIPLFLFYYLFLLAYGSLSRFLFLTTKCSLRQPSVLSQIHLHHSVKAQCLYLEIEPHF